MTFLGAGLNAASEKFGMCHLVEAVLQAEHKEFVSDVRGKCAPVVLPSSRPLIYTHCLP
jgi:hypothetical protein